MDHEKEVVDFDQLVRIFVDTDVDTHFIVSLPRTSTVAELRGLVKATHRHCYPDSGNVEIGKLAVPGGDYGYHLADFLLIGQVYDRYEGKVFAEVKDHDPSSSSQGLFRVPTLSLKTSSTPKKVASQAFENGGGEVLEPGNLLAAVGFNACELVVPKLQKEEIDEDGICVLGSQAPLDDLPKDEEEDEKLLELPEPEVSLCEITAPNIQGNTRKRSASECNERPSKSRRLTEPAPTPKAPSDGAAVLNAAATFMNRPDDLDADVSSPSGSKRRKKKVDLKVIESVMPEVEDKEEMRNEEKKVTVLVIGSGEDGNGNGGDDGLGNGGEDGIGNGGEDGIGISGQDGIGDGGQDGIGDGGQDGIGDGGQDGIGDGSQDGIGDGGQDGINNDGQDGIVNGGQDGIGDGGQDGIGDGGLGVGKEEEACFLLEDPNVLAALATIGKKKRRVKKLRTVKELELEKEEKEGKKEKKLKQKEPEQEMELDAEKEPEEEKNPEEVGKMVVTKENKGKKEKAKRKPRNVKKKEEPKDEEVPEKEKEPEDVHVPGEKKEAVTEKKDKKDKIQKQKEPEQEEPEKVEEMMEKKDRKNKKGKKEGRKHKSLDQKELQQEKEKEPEEERLETEEKKQEQFIEEITPLDCPSLNSLLEVSEGKPPQEDAAAVSADHSDHAVNDEEDSDDDDVPGPEAKKGRAVRDEVSESGTPQREAQVSRDTSEEVHGGMAKASTPKTNLFGGVNNMEISPSYHGGSDPSPETQGTKTGSVKSQESPIPSKHLSFTGAGRGAPSQTRSIESSRDMMKGKQTGGRNFKAIESQSECSEKATQQSEGINLDSEVSGAWLRRGLLDSEPGHIDQSQVAKPTHSRSRSGESSEESDPRSADQTEVSRKDDHVPEASQINHVVKSPEKHAAKRSDGGEVNLKIDSLEFFSQDQSYHVAPTQVQKALSGSTTEESSDESDDEDTDHLKKKPPGNLSIRGAESDESSDESGELATPARPSFPPLTTRTPLPSVSRMTGDGGSQSFKRRSSGVAAEIEAKFAQFIESQGGLDELMGITLGQRKRSMPVESEGAGSLVMPFGSPLDIALNTQESVKTSPIALDAATTLRSSPEKYATPQFKVPKPVLVGMTSGAARGLLKPAATPAPRPSREAPKARAVKELRLKRKETTPPLDKLKESGGLLSKKSNVGPLPALGKETFLDKGAVERKVKDPSLSTPPRTSKATIPDALNANESSLLKSSEKKKRRDQEKQQDSQFMIVNNTDHISEQEKEDKRNWSEEDGGLTVTKKELNMVETGVVGSQEMFVLDSSGKKKKRKISEKEPGSRKKRMKFQPEDLYGKELTVLPENSVERSARETEELYVKLEKANRDLWLQNNMSVASSFRKDADKIGSRAAEYFDDTEGGEDDVAQSRLVPEEPELVDEPVVNDDELKTSGPPPASPVLFAGTTEASDREDDSSFLSQDEKAETSQQEKFKITDVFDYVSDDQLPTKVLSMQKTGMKEKRKAKRMEEVSGKAVQRVLDDEMLHVADASDAPGKNSRKAAKPIKWTVRLRSLSPASLATSPHGGTIPFDAAAVAAAADFRTSYRTVEQVAATKPESATETPKVRRGPKSKTEDGTETPKVRRGPKSRTEDVFDGSGCVLCPLGCGKGYRKKTSAFYLHQKTCPLAPAVEKTPSSKQKTKQTAVRAK